MLEIDDKFTKFADELKDDIKKIVDENKSVRDLKDLTEMYGRRGWRTGAVADVRQMLIYAAALVYKVKNMGD